MQIHVNDEGFVRAPVGLVYRRLTDVGAWQDWWPGIRVRPDAAAGEAWLIELGRRLRPLRVHARPHGWRHDAGFAMDLTGDLMGKAEFWLESGYGGTVVHHVLLADGDGRRPMATQRVYRKAVRRGLTGFKDAVQTEVRETVGLDP